MSGALHVVTGALGYTGRAVAERLLARGERVRTLTNSPGRPNPFGAALEVRPLAFTLVIEDDGCGLNATKLNGAARKDRISSGHGLANMDKRLRAAGGGCVITSKESQGTRVEFSVDLAAPRSPEMVTGGNGVSN